MAFYRERAKDREQCRNLPGDCKTGNGESMLDRRQFLTGLGAAAIIPSLPADPLVRFVRYQSWPLGTPRPSINYWCGMTGSIAADAPKYRLSEVLRPHMTYVTEIG